MIVPVSLLLGQLAFWYQYRPLRVGEEAVVTLKLSGDAQATVARGALEADHAPSRSSPARSACRASARSAGTSRRARTDSHRLAFQVAGSGRRQGAGGRRRLHAGQPAPARLGLVGRPAQPWRAAFSPRLAVHSIEVVYPDRTRGPAAPTVGRSTGSSSRWSPPCVFAAPERQCLSTISAPREGRGMSSEIMIVSGLPRSGTSLMMQMLDNGGIDGRHRQHPDRRHRQPPRLLRIRERQEDQARRLLAARDARQGVQDGLAAPLRPAADRDNTGSSSWIATWMRCWSRRRKCWND